jgi:hypothetical protein
MQRNQKNKQRNYVINVSGGNAVVENKIENLSLTNYYGDRAEPKDDEKLARKITLEGIDIAPFIPISLHESFRKGDKLLEKHYLEEEEIIYHEIEGEEGKRNYWKTPQLLPIRLYDVNEEKLIETTKETNIDNYATLSYVWGDTYSLETKRIETERGLVDKKLSPGGIKSLEKAIEACRHLRIDYLWMDQLCIDQNNLEEKNQEVPKMRKYYNNAAVTLIAIQSKLHPEIKSSISPINIIEKIIKSEWFSRSWTFQEGWLSKHTIFMFDDALVDGRELAATWVLHQPGYSDYVAGKLEEINENSAKVATPLGWVYHKEGYNSEDKVSLGLSQTLRGIKERNRTLSIDGIYSILGLLPYGDKITPKYKKWGEEYTQEDIEQSLYEVMKTALVNGYAEPLSWHGEGNDLMPNIVDSKKCLTNITGGIFIRQKKIEPESPASFTSEGIKINGSEYVIDGTTSELSEVENQEGFLIEGGLCVRSVRVKIDNKSSLEEIRLWGTRETLQKIKKGDSLIVPSSKEWESNIPFAILASRRGKIYYRLGLVELRSRADQLTGNKERKFILKLDSSNFKQIEPEVIELQIQEAQVEVPPKGNG